MTSKDEPSDFSEISAAIFTIARPKTALRLLETVKSHLPSMAVKVFVQGNWDPADKEHADSLGAELVFLEFDAGISKSRNAAMAHATSPYVLLLDDDFMFFNTKGLRDALTVLRHHPDLLMVGGAYLDLNSEPSGSVRHQLRPEASNIFYDPKERACILMPAAISGSNWETVAGVDFVRCDYVLQYLLVRRDQFVASGIGWDERMKSSGEHLDFFWQLKEMVPKAVAYVPTFSILHDRHSPPEYTNLRQRTEGELIAAERWSMARRITVDPDGRGISAQIYSSGGVENTRLLQSGQIRVWEPRTAPELKRVFRIHPIYQPELKARFFDETTLSSNDGEFELGGVAYFPGASHTSLRVCDSEGREVGASKSINLRSPAVANRFADDPIAGASRFWASIKVGSDARSESLTLEMDFGEAGRLKLAEIVPWAEVAGSISNQFVSHFRHKDRDLYFSVANRSDAVQKFHANGAFYELALLEALSAKTPENGLVLDVGSNVGNHAIYLDKFTQAQEIIVLEAGTRASEILLANLELNDCQNINPTFLGYVVSDGSDQSFQSAPTPHNNLGAQQFEAADPQNETTLPSITIDEIVGARTCHVMKIDVERMELDVLRGARRTLERDHPTLAVEVTPGSRPEVEAFLRDFGYVFVDRFVQYTDCETLLFT